MSTKVSGDRYVLPSLAAAADGTPTLAAAWSGFYVGVVQGTGPGAGWNTAVSLGTRVSRGPVVAVAANGTRRVVVWHAWKGSREFVQTSVWR